MYDALVDLHGTTVLVFATAIGLEALGALLRYREWIEEVVGRESTGAFNENTERDRHRVHYARVQGNRWWSAIVFLPTGYSPLPRGLARIMVVSMLLVRFALGEPILPSIIS